jgi:hypothetical protein
VLEHCACNLAYSLKLLQVHRDLQQMKGRRTHLVLPQWLESVRKDLDNVQPQVHLQHKKQKEQERALSIKREQADTKWN